jgi:hypothetical protein
MFVYPARCRLMLAAKEALNAATQKTVAATQPTLACSPLGSLAKRFSSPVAEGRERAGVNIDSAEYIPAASLLQEAGAERTSSGGGHVGTLDFPSARGTLENTAPPPRAQPLVAELNGYNLNDDDFLMSGSPSKGTPRMSAGKAPMTRKITSEFAKKLTADLEDAPRKPKPRKVPSRYGNLQPQPPPGSPGYEHSSNPARSGRAPGRC